MWRFHEAALPHLNDLYTLARYLMRNPDDAEDAVQDCYLRGLRYFDSYRGPAMKPWLLAILRNICLSEFTRRGKQEPLTEYFDDEMLGEQITGAASLTGKRARCAARRRRYASAC